MELEALQEAVRRPDAFPCTGLRSPGAPVWMGTDSTGPELEAESRDGPSPRTDAECGVEVPVNRSDAGTRTVRGEACTIRNSYRRYEIRT